MSVKAFELVPAVERALLMGDKARINIECIECCGKNLYVGTNDCFVYHFLLEEKTTSKEKLTFSVQKQQHKYLGLKKPVSELKAASALNRLIVLCDNTIMLVNMLNLDPVQSGAKIKGVATFTVNENPVNGDPFCVELGVISVKRRTIQIYMVYEDRVQIVKELATPEQPSAVSLDGYFLCLALTTQYIIVNYSTGASQDLFPFDTEEKKPIVKRIGREEFLLAGPGGLGMFATAAGISQRAPVHWSENVIGAAICFPYVVALDEGFVTVHSMLDQQLKQTLPFRDGHIMQEFEGKVILATMKEVYVLVPLPLERQIQDLLASQRVEEAIVLAEGAQRNIPKEKFLPPDIKGGLSAGGPSQPFSLVFLVWEGGPPLEILPRGANSRLVWVLRGLRPQLGRMLLRPGPGRGATATPGTSVHPSTSTATVFTIIPGDLGLIGTPRGDGRKKEEELQEATATAATGGHRPDLHSNEGCPGCGEFGHTVAICPTQTEVRRRRQRGRKTWEEEEWCTHCMQYGHEEHHCLEVLQDTDLEWQEPERPAPDWEEPERPALSGRSRASTAQEGGVSASTAQEGGVSASTAQEGGVSASTAQEGGVSASTAQEGGVSASTAQEGGVSASTAQEGGVSASTAQEGGVSASTAQEGGVSASTAQEGGVSASTAQEGGVSASTAQEGGVSASTAQEGGVSASTAQEGGVSASTAQEGGVSASTAQEGGVSASTAQEGGVSASTAQEGGVSASTAQEGGVSASTAQEGGVSASTAQEGGVSASTTQEGEGRTSTAQVSASRGRIPAGSASPPWEDCVSLPPPPAEGEFLLVPPPPSWEDDLLLPPPLAEGKYLLVPPPSPPPAEGACLLVPQLLPSRESEGVELPSREPEWGGAAVPRAGREWCCHPESRKGVELPSREPEGGGTAVPRAGRGWSHGPESQKGRSHGPQKQKWRSHRPENRKGRRLTLLSSPYTCC
ncbi:UNVERIFIED_CONTAM: hypothetical protein FKN15_060553 [Acipenser sinensis]